MNSKLLRLIVLPGILFTTCKKLDVVPDQFGQPVFFVEATADGEQILWEAGRENYYMYTDFENSLSDVPAYVADFKKTTCDPTCTERIRIKIFHDNPQAPHTEQEVAQALKPGDFTFWDEFIPPQTQKLRLDAVPFGQPPFSYEWTVDGNVIGTSSSEIVDLMPNTNATIGLKSTDALNCTSQMVKSIDPLDLNSCAFTFQVEADSSGGYVIGAVPINPGVVYTDFLWSTGDTFPVIYVDLRDTLQGITLWAMSSSGCLYVNWLNFSVINSNPANPGICSVDFSFKADSTSNPPTPEKFSKVILEYWDATGKYFSSVTSIPFPNQIFEILSVEDFEKNENGLPVKKLEVRFDAMLQSQDGMLINVKSLKSSIAVAYPN